MNVKEIIGLLNTENTKNLFETAYATKLNTIGAYTYLRALIEYSNFCQRNCYYCGIRKENNNCTRYKIPLEQAKNIIFSINRQKYASFLIQSGEKTDKKSISEINQLIEYAKNLNPDFGIVLSVGEQKKETYKKWFELGAERYLLRIETSNKKLYESVHPPEMSYENRIKCLHNLKEIGFQTGTGNLIGLPNQTIESLANDILFFKKMDIDMLGLGPYIPCKNTPLYSSAEKVNIKRNFELTLKTIAICRILLKNVNIAASTALQTIDSEGYIKGIKAGANVIMPNMTPEIYKKSYSLYNNKAFVDDSQILSYAKILHETINPSLRGDPLHFTENTASQRDIKEEA